MLNSFEALQLALQRDAKKRQEHTPSPAPTGDLDLVRSLGLSEIVFQDKLKKLCTSWWGIYAIVPGDLEAKRFVTKIIGDHISDPAIVSIIVDDYDSFEKQIKNRTDLYYFDFCCLCGAENIINRFFLADETRKTCLLNSEDPIGLAVSSGNEQFAINLSKEAIRLGRISPGSICIYSNGNDAIERAALQVFHEATQSRSSSASTEESSLEQNDSIKTTPQKPKM